MSDDFKVGDVVVCVRGFDEGEGPPRHHFGDVAEGDVLRVMAMWLQWDDVDPDPFTLAFYGHANYCYPASCFRKLPSASDEFTRQMRALNPHRTTVPA